MYYSTWKWHEYFCDTSHEFTFHPLSSNPHTKQNIVVLYQFSLPNKAPPPSQHRVMAYTHTRISDWCKPCRYKCSMIGSTQPQIPRHYHNNSAGVYLYGIIGTTTTENFFRRARFKVGSRRCVTVGSHRYVHNSRLDPETKCSWVEST